MTTQTQTPAEFIRNTLRGHATVEQAAERVLVAYPFLSDEVLAAAFDQAGEMLAAEAAELRRMARGAA